MGRAELAYIGLGSNLGRRERNLREAASRIGALPGVRALRRSSLYESAPVGGPPQPWYLNAVLEIETSLGPVNLLRELSRIEKAMGRRRGERNTPRIIDCDVLLFGNRVIAAATLTVPHPRLHERRFVLEPLAELAGALVHPASGRTVRDLLEELSDGCEVRACGGRGTRNGGRFPPRPRARAEKRRERRVRCKPLK